MKIEIKSIGGSVLFEGDFGTIAEAVVAAIKKKADLSSVDLSSVDLSSADLSSADFRSANLSSADLSSADLSYANLSSANLSSANLSSANLSYANLSSADFRSADGSELAIAITRILPEGDIIGWKKCRNDKIVKLLIPATAKRSHAFGRKCRAEFAIVLEISDGGQAESYRSDGFIYKVGETVKPAAAFDEDWADECASGIHFYITRIEAENHS